MKGLYLLSLARPHEAHPGINMVDVADTVVALQSCLSGMMEGQQRDKELKELGRRLWQQGRMMAKRINAMEAQVRERSRDGARDGHTGP